MQNVLLSWIRVDLILETISGVIALMVSHYANKAFRLTGQKRLSDLSTGFLVLSAGMFGRVLGTLYFFVLAAQGGPSSPSAQTLMGVVIVAYGVMRVMAYLVFAVATRHSRKEDVPEQAPLALALAIPILVSPTLEMLAIIVLVIIVLQNLMNYLAVKTRYALYVLIGFVLLLVSHILGIFSLTDLRGYALSQVAQFLGFSSFLILLRKASGDE
ncbi:hypothetical protein EU537_04060 [Candidatus Thorarchaeota archaeon]|nr:MAG: hypothetical protein EU537_04060 [Candidatus Thorarchaeota archaeon]